MFTYSSSNRSSSSISDFVQSRLSGRVPIFGGNIANGLVDIREAVKGTTRHHAIAALSSVTAALVRVQEAIADEPIQPLDQEVHVAQESADDVERLLDCATFEHKRVESLLQSSRITEGEIEDYKTLIYATCEFVQDQRRTSESATSSYAFNFATTDYATDQEILSCVAEKRASIDAYARNLGIYSHRGQLAMYRAFVHDSLTTGKITNRSLAMIGDAALALLLKQELLAMHTSLKEVSQQLQATQSNIALCRLGVINSLHDYICASSNTDKCAKSVMATTVEAIYGAIYEYGGIALVKQANELHLKVFSLT